MLYDESNLNLLSLFLRNQKKKKGKGKSNIIREMLSCMHIAYILR